MNKAIFIDKDGTLIHDIPYNADPDLIRLEPKAECLRKLTEQGYKLIVISNQSGVALGYFPERALKKVEKKLSLLLKDINILLDGFYYCPHHPFARIKKYAVICDCRKPACGMLKKAAKDHQVILKDSWMIGDILNDVEAGKRAGCKTILIDNGNETEWKQSQKRIPDFIAKDLGEATIFILENSMHHEQGLV